MHAALYVCGYVCLCTCIYDHICICKCVNVCVCVFVYLFVCAFVRLLLRSFGCLPFFCVWTQAVAGIFKNAFRWFSLCMCLIKCLLVCLMYVSVHKYGYGACGGAALSALFEVMIRKPFFIIMRDATVQLCCCVFLQSLANWSHREQPGAKTSCNHCHIRQCLISATVVSCTFNFLGERLRGMYDFIWSQVQSRKKMLRRIKSVLEVTWRRCLGSYLKKMLRRIKSVLAVTWRSSYDVSRASWKLLEEAVPTHQECLGN